MCEKQKESYRNEVEELNVKRDPKMEWFILSAAIYSTRKILFNGNKLFSYFQKFYISDK